MAESKLEECDRFIREHYPVARARSANDIMNWVIWAASKDFLIRIYDNPVSKNLVGLVIARPTITSGEHTEEDCTYDENGNFIFLDLVIAYGRKAFRAIAETLVRRFGDRDYVATRNRHGKLRVYDYKNLKKALLRT